MLISLRTWMTRALLLMPLLLVACGGSSDDGGPTDPGDEPPPTNGNGNGDTPGDNGNGNGNGHNDEPPTDSEASGPEDAYDASDYLNYTEHYDGEADWAVIDGNTQDPVQVADATQLGNALMVLPYFVAVEVLQEEAGVPEDLLEFMDLRECGSDEEKHLGAPADSAAGCLRARSADNAEIDYQGGVNWHQDEEVFDQMVDLQGFELDWRGETFTLDGAVGFQEDPSAIYMAFDVTHHETQESYRYWIRHSYGLSITSPQINSIVFHPQQGAVAVMAETAFAREGSCEGGGFENEVGVMLDGAADTGPNTSIQFENWACDVFGFGMVSSTDSEGAQVRQAIHPAFASLGMDFGVEVTPWTTETTHQLGMTAEDNYLEPELVAVAEMGYEREGDDWTRYEIAMTYDMSDLPSELLNNGLLTAYLSAYSPSVTDDPNITMNQAAMGDWGAEPSGSDYLGEDLTSASGQTGLAGNGGLPWWAIDTTEMLELAIDEGRSHLNIVLQIDSTGVILGPPDEGEHIVTLCASQAGECEEYELPTIHLAYPEH